MPKYQPENIGQGLTSSYALFPCVVQVPGLDPVSAWPPTAVGASKCSDGLPDQEYGRMMAEVGREGSALPRRCQEERWSE